MKKIFVFLIITVFALPSFGLRTTVDSINVAGLAGTDTMIVISKSFINFGRDWAAEFEYTDLSHDDATLDIGTRLELEGGYNGQIADSTFNSFGDILGIAFPYTLDATTNADGHYSKASLLVQHPGRMQGTELLIRITKGSVTSGYIRYKIVW